ncbi:MAG: NADP-dependent glyceraldehyde-3-phosphate dehydrogenase [Candidatus Omnitrophica bacterium]|nr:NADP-dependent glyceraldehyde-3-phosphate dehydrogenase [Candidatus Omnitrophota bacterium]
MAKKSVFPKSADIPERFRWSGTLDQDRYLIGGELRQWKGETEEVYSPIYVDSRPVLLGHYPLLTERKSLEALDAACAAYDRGRGAWPTMSVEARIRHVEAFVGRMQAAREEVVKILMWEIGKTLKDSEKEFDRTVEYIRDTVTALKDLDRTSSKFVIEQGVLGQIRRSPLGVVLCMGPYNYPLNETFTTLIPALIMGNAVIFKPPKLGVLLHAPLLEAFKESFPPGVVNTVYGEGQKIIGPLMQSGRIDALAFIGSSHVANILQKQHPKPHRCRFVLGLEAKNAAIILEDADLDEAVKECVLGSLSYNGQRCTALKMIFVHATIADAFVEKFISAVEKLKCGMPWEDGVFITPLPEPDKTSYLDELVKDAQKTGALVMGHGGGVMDRTLFYPAVLYPVLPGMRIYSEEQFGPVVPIARFVRIEEAVEYIMDSNYGQQASVFGKDPDKIAKLIDPLVNQVCRVNINSQCQRGPDLFPFTGRKDSAEGTLSVTDALKVFSIRSLVAAKETPANKSIITGIIRERKSNFLSTDYLL